MRIMLSRGESVSRGGDLAAASPSVVAGGAIEPSAAEAGTTGDLEEEPALSNGSNLT